jgi:hypothetical protein
MIKKDIQNEERALVKRQSGFGLGEDGSRDDSPSTVSFLIEE